MDSCSLGLIIVYAADATEDFSHASSSAKVSTKIHPSAASPPPISWDRPNRVRSAMTTTWTRPRMVSIVIYGCVTIHPSIQTSPLFSTCKSHPMSMHPPFREATYMYTLALQHSAVTELSPITFPDPSLSWYTYSCTPSTPRIETRFRTGPPRRSQPTWTHTCPPKVVHFSVI